MKAITIPGLEWADVLDPIPGPDEELATIHAAGVNRADLLQAKGLYPAPVGVTGILGLEMSGVMPDGRRVCSLLPGGGYAEKVAVHPDMLLDLPDHWTFEQGAAVPEVWLTAFVNLFLEGNLQAGETVLIHAGASGVGTAAIQLARDAGAARVLVTVRSPEKAQRCWDLGAEVIPPEHSEQVDLIIDCIGGAYLSQNIQALKPFGRLINIGLLGGSKGELNLTAILRNRLTIKGSTLRSRPRTEHIRIVKAFKERFWQKLIDGQFQIPIDRTFPIEETAEAHRYMAENRNFGKIVLVVGR
jgi:putative PIG3 family NAD(P)H quinone oxidoreductase